MLNTMSPYAPQRSASIEWKTTFVPRHCLETLGLAYVQEFPFAPPHVLTAEMHPTLISGTTRLGCALVNRSEPLRDSF